MMRFIGKKIIFVSNSKKMTQIYKYILAIFMLLTLNVSSQNSIEKDPELLQNKIFTACYWPNVLEECPADSLDYKLAKYILPLPVEQRYNSEDMERICNVLLAVL